MIALGIDSSNYRSSAAAFFDDSTYISERKLLYVENGKCGLRQSDAVFLHTKQLPQVVGAVLDKIDCNNVGCIGVSATPRSVMRSYMPCFLSGVAIAKTLSKALKVPLYEFSHQDGHIASALLSANETKLFKEKFIAFHLSGGTTEAVLVSPSDSYGFKTEIIAKTLDVSVGQIIDRVGVMLGLDFPCGEQFEKIAISGIPKSNIRPTLKENDCCLSGVQNICQKMFDNGESAQNICATALFYVIKTVCQMAENLRKIYPEYKMIFSGGVASNSALKYEIQNTLKTGISFATPELSSDNAVGISLLAKMAYRSI